MKQVFRRVIDRRGNVVVVELPEPHVGPGPGPRAEPLLADQLGYRDEHAREDTGRAGQADAVRSVDAQRGEADGDLAPGMTQSARRIWHEMITPREIGYSGAGTVTGLSATTSRASRSARRWRTRPPVTRSSPRRRSTTSCRFRTTSTSATRRSSPSAGSPRRRCVAPTCSSVRSSRSTGSVSSASSPRGSRSRPAASSSAST